jgi:hypothetical protein
MTNDPAENSFERLHVTVGFIWDNCKSRTVKVVPLSAPAHPEMLLDIGAPGPDISLSVSYGRIFSCGRIFGLVSRGVLPLPQLAQRHLCQGEFVL